MPGLIDWEHPPSTRVRARAYASHLLGDLVVLLACGTILRVLVGALRGDAGVSARNLRLYLVEGLGGSTWILWAASGAVVLAALYALIDGWHTLRAGMRARVPPRSDGGDGDGAHTHRPGDRPTVHVERDPE